MNWQARMSEIRSSKMIESLGTVLDYRMNRANVKEIHLAEELQCIDAYFYIMSMRFGQRLSIERKIDDDLLYLMVPPLITADCGKCDCAWGRDGKKTASSGFVAR